MMGNRKYSVKKTAVLSLLLTLTLCLGLVPIETDHSPDNAETTNVQVDGFFVLAVTVRNTHESDSALNVKLDPLHSTDYEFIRSRTYPGGEWSAVKWITHATLGPGEEIVTQSVFRAVEDNPEISDDIYVWVHGDDIANRWVNFTNMSIFYNYPSSGWWGQPVSVNTMFANRSLAEVRPLLCEGVNDTVYDQIQSTLKVVDKDGNPVSHTAFDWDKDENGTVKATIRWSVAPSGQDRLAAKRIRSFLITYDGDICNITLDNNQGAVIRHEESRFENHILAAETAMEKDRETLPGPWEFSAKNYDVGSVNEMNYALKHYEGLYFSGHGNPTGNCIFFTNETQYCTSSIDNGIGARIVVLAACYVGKDLLPELVYEGVKCGIGTESTIRDFFNTCDDWANDFWDSLTGNEDFGAAPFTAHEAREYANSYWNLYVCNLDQEEGECNIYI